ncbi:MAG: hypothetical protein WCS98_04595 [Bacillota bacterium]|nr:hypothetical protein [Bacillota bacterium]MDD3299184.1 hypothetical protein [Bacillota bacterium]MDD3851524.1 hypothetical protein [Bacillota bacterium]MDD4708260.1 hypothetical protein [Bacillota bacterium]
MSKCGRECYTGRFSGWFFYNEFRRWRKGCRTKSFRQVIRDGRPEADEALSIDLYKPEKAVIRKGPQESAPDSLSIIQNDEQE